MYLPAGISGLCMWEEAAGQGRDEKADFAVGGGIEGKQPLKKRKAESI